MKTALVLAAVTVLNATMLVATIAGRALSDEAAPVLRGRALEIVDAQGRVRASIGVYPPERLADGSTYPESVLLRLVNESGRPNVKIQASTDGGVLMVGGNADPAFASLGARGSEPVLQLVDSHGEKQVFGSAN